MPLLPPLAILLGLLGLLPFLGCAAGAILLPPEKAAGYLAALIAYAAVILGFLGAVHWGFALVLNPDKVPRRLIANRLLGGTLPALIAWCALLLVPATGPTSALGLLILGFAATLAAEHRAWKRGGMPNGYMRLRWTLSTIVILTLTVTTIVRIMGLRIII